MKRKMFYILIAAVLLTLLSVSAFAAAEENGGYEKAANQSYCSDSGDIDFDGSITAADARLALRYCVLLEKMDDEMIYRADVDGDGKVTGADARILLRCAVGLENNFSHTKLETVILTEATCASSGTCADLCANCGKLYNYGKIPQTDHFAAGWNILKEATCSKEGLGEMRCIYCDMVMDTKVIPKRSHDYGSLQYETAPDCFHYVNTYRVCEVCGVIERSTEAPVGAHSLLWETVKAATCTEDGLAAEKCVRCGYVTGNTKTIKCAGTHTVSEWRTVKYATCTEDGLRTKTCHRCKEVYDTEIIPSPGHSIEVGTYNVLAEATCTEAGKMQYRCSVCKRTVIGDISAKGHTPEGEPVVNAPTCVDEGSETFICSSCGEEINLVLPAAGHTPGEWEFVKLEDGNYFIRKCTVCHEEIDRSERYD